MIQISAGAPSLSRRKAGGCRVALDEAGKRYGRLTVLERAPNKKNYATWLCRCDCGGEVETRGTQLRCGISRSCGCLRNDRARERLSLPVGISARNRALATMRANARRRGLDWSLPRDQALTLMSEDCFYCGAEPSNVSQGRNGAFTYNGLDRIDASEGYFPDNVVAACYQCNQAKRRKSPDEFLTWVKRIYFHSVGRKGM